MKGQRLTREEALVKGLAAERAVLAELRRLGAGELQHLGPYRLGYKGEGLPDYHIPVDILVATWEGDPIHRPPGIQHMPFGVQVKAKQPRVSYPDTGFDYDQLPRYRHTDTWLPLLVVWVTDSWDNEYGHTLWTAHAARLGRFYGAWLADLPYNYRKGEIGADGSQQAYWRLTDMMPLDEAIKGPVEATLWELS